MGSYYNPISVLVMQQISKNLHPIRDEMVRWKKILEEPYREYLQPK